ncbi:hypothetical protein B7463_g12424, partial [Scytalidium lignicola]
MAITAIVTTVIAGIATILRILARSLIVRRMGWDDWLMLIGMIFVAGYLFEILYSIHFGLGLHSANVNPKNIELLLKLNLGIEAIYPVIVAFIKLSILFFYLRLVSIEGFFRTAVKITIGFLTIFAIQSEISTLAQCIPFRKIYDITGTVEGTCINTTAYFYFLASCNVILDIWILVLPIKTIMDIKRPRKEKLVLFTVFGAGAFSCISGIVRLYTIGKFTYSKDPFYDAIPINIWSFVEISTAIVCASAPAMKPLFTPGKHSSSTNSGSTPFSQRYRTHNSIPLSGTEPRPKLGNSVEAHIYSVKTKGRTGSQERIVPTGIEYQREFSVQEEYIEMTPTQKKKTEDEMTDSSSK